MKIHSLYLPKQEVENGNFKEEHEVLGDEKFAEFIKESDRIWDAYIKALEESPWGIPHGRGGKNVYRFIELEFDVISEINYCNFGLITPEKCESIIDSIKSIFDKFNVEFPDISSIIEKKYKI